jgi:hypothetical protein
MTVFAILTDGPSKCDLLLQLVDLKDDSVVQDIPVKDVKFPSRIGGVELQLQLEGTTFVHPGAYDIRLLSGDTPLQSYRIDVEETRKV